MNILNIVLILLGVWTVPWKIYAVWLACKHDRKAWFVVLIFLNTLSILELVYIFRVEKKKWSEVKTDFKGGWITFKQAIKRK